MQLPIGAEWETVNLELAQQLIQQYNITSVSSQIQVMNEITPKIAEPGNHGSIVTIGDLPPLNEPWVNAFNYDCTRTKPHE